MNARELRLGNKIYFIMCDSEDQNMDEKKEITIYDDDMTYMFNNESLFEPIPLTEEWLQKLGFSVINESSAGKRYGYVVDGVFSSDLTFTFWKTTKEVGKFFRGGLELKSVHQLQNLYFALTGAELTVA